jgi:hypothetical protein
MGDEAQQTQQAEKFSISTQIFEVEREIKMRKRVYERMSFPNNTFLRKSEADMALAIMENVLTTLQWNRDNRAAVIEWIKNRKPKSAS